MSNKTCDLRSVFNIFTTSAYKAGILDSLTNKISVVLVTPAKHLPVFIGSTVAYTIRDLARECGDEYLPSFSGYIPYIAGITGGAFKYSIKGLYSDTSLVENSVLGGINNLGYEILKDADLDAVAYTIPVLVLEAMEPVLAYQLFGSQLHDLNKNIAINAVFSLIMSAEACFIYGPTIDYIEALSNKVYDSIKYVSDTTLEFIGYNSATSHDDL